MVRRLLEDDYEQRIYLEKTIAMQSRVVCCQLLAVILLTNIVAKPYVFWNQFKTRLYDNVKYKLCHMNYYQADQKIPENNVYDYSLWNLNRMLVGIKRSLAEFLPMFLPQQEQNHRIPNSLLQTEQYDADEMATLVNKQRAIFNSEQTATFDTVLESVTNNQGYLFFIHAVGGCRKTFLYNTIGTEVRRKEQVVLYVVSSGITTFLLDGGRTFYSCFKISFPINEDTMARLKQNSHMFSVTQQTKVIIWNKVPIQHKYNIDAINQYLRDLLEVSDHLYLIAIKLIYYLE